MGRVKAAIEKSSVDDTTEDMVYYGVACRTVMNVSEGTLLLARSAQLSMIIQEILSAEETSSNGSLNNIISLINDNASSRLEWTEYCNFLGKPVLQWYSRDICMETTYAGLGRELRKALPVFTDIRAS